MKRLNIRWTIFASRALHEIHLYLEHESGSEAVADRYIIKLASRVDQLAYFPDSGEKEHRLIEKGQNSRYLLEGNNKIIYQRRGEEIIITDIFHTKQNPAKIVKRSKEK